MASYQGKLKQYLLIIKQLRVSSNCLYQEILQVLEVNGFKMSKRTFHRNLEALRDEFGIEILCDRKTNRYYIEEENCVNTDVVIKFLHLAEQADFVISSLREYKGVSKSVLLSENLNPKGLEYLPPILKAIKDNLQLRISHQKYGGEEQKEYIIAPYYLKEYANMWYVIAFIPERNDFRTFGVDRINDLALTSDSFIRQEDDSLPYFEDVIGVNFGDYASKPKEVLFKTSEKAARYIRSKPFHHSQVEVAPNTFRISVVPNYELQQQLLSQGKHLTVLQPESLRQELIKTLQETLSNY